MTLAVLVWSSIGPALAQTASEARQPPAITVEGHAMASVVPDTAIISLGVVTERPRAADAAADNAKATEAVFEAIRADNVEAKDVQTASVDLAAIYDQPTHGSPKITGFRASNQVQIRVKPAERAGQLAGKLIDKGVNSIDSIDFVRSPDEALQDKLRADAMRDARHKAEVYVDAVGVKLGRIMAIVPSGNEPGPAPKAYRMAKAALAAAPAPVPLAAGTQDLQEEVSVTFELVQ